MKFRVIHHMYLPSYFKTERAAILFQNAMGGEIQKKIGCDWVSY